MKKIIFISFVLLLNSFNGFSQVFSNSTVSAAGWNGTLTKTVTVSGLSNLSAGFFELVQVNLDMGDNVNGVDYDRYKITLTKGSTTIILVAVGEFPGPSVKRINTKFRYNTYLRTISDYGLTAGNAEPFSIGYYGSQDNFNAFNGIIDPNGDWTLTITENSVSDGAKFNKVDLVFKSPYTVQDYTTLNSYDNCSAPYCLGTAEIIVASNNGFTAQNSDMFNSNTNGGCQWNAFRNNSAWFKFIAQSPNVKITISGITNSLQILGIRSSGANPCTSANNTVLTGGCPDDTTINDTYLSPQYFNGSIFNNQLNMSGLTPGNTYYFIVDGTSAAVSPFYIETTGTSLDCSNCALNATLGSNSPVCANGTLNLTCNDGTSWSWTGPNGFTSSSQNPTLNNVTSLASGTYTVAITDNNGCTDTKSIDVVINSSVTPTFNTPSPVCLGSTLNPLPTTSNNGIEGSWSPDLNNSQTTIYTFTPNSGQCATSTTLTVTITPQTTPAFSFGTTLTICSGGTVPALPTSSSNSITGSWSPAIVDNANNGTYTFTPDAGQCATTANLTVVINPEITGTTNANPNTVCNASSSGCTPTGTKVVINEVMHFPLTAQGLVATGTEYIELYNPTCSPIDLSCYTIATAARPNSNPGSTLSRGGTVLIPSGTILAPKSHYVIGTSTSSSNLANIDYNTTLTSNYCAINQFVLANGDGWVSLNDANGTPVDAIYWTVGANESSKITTDDDLDDAPCIPSSLGACNTSSLTLLSAKDIHQLNSSLINYVGQTTLQGLSSTGNTFSRIPDGGAWQRDIPGSINLINCNNGICDTPPASTCNGSATVTITQGSGNYSYLWNDPQAQTTATATNLCAGNYCVTVTDLDTNCTQQFCVTVNDTIPNITPTFSFGTTLSICSGGTVPALPTSSSNSITGTWSPAIVDNANNGTYTFTPDAGQCATTTTFTVSITQQITPTFSFGTTLTVCSGGIVPALPTSSSNSITGTWSPAIVDNANNGTYTFTPDAGQCATTTTFTVTITPQTTPTFSFGNVTACQGVSLQVLLPNLSNNGISGSWSPSTIDYSILGQTVYTFTPDIGQCATTTTFTVTVIPRTTPTFSFGTTLTVCSGGTVPALPTSSSNSITGTWSPAIVDNANNGTYTFTPDAGQCATTTTFTVSVTQQTTPTFSFGTTLTVCSGGIVPALPTSSSNSITGTWSPAIVDNANNGTYTFTPDAGQCATTTTFTVTVTQQTTPTFSFGNVTACQGVSPQVLLPNLSNNGISGSWSPSTIDYSILGQTVYTFTPDIGQCATTTTFTVTVIPRTNPTFSFGTSLTACQGDVSAQVLLPTTSDNAVTGSWNPSTIDYSLLGQTVYTFTPDAGQCAFNTTLTVTVNAIPQFTISGGCDGEKYVLQIVEENQNINLVEWYFNNTMIGQGNSILINGEGTYTAVATNADTCDNSAQFVVSNDYCSIQKGISVNNDGLNDVFELTNLDVNYLQIFNRYGMEVYSKRNYTNEWGGNSNDGDELPDGTYYYVIEQRSGTVKTGWIYINRAQ